MKTISNIKSGIKGLLVLLLLQFSVSSLSATDYYWIGGSGDWTDLTHWATTSGGATNHVIVPSPLDKVIFDANSGLDGGTVVMNFESFCGEFDFQVVNPAGTIFDMNAPFNAFVSMNLAGNVTWQQVGKIRVGPSGLTFGDDVSMTGAAEVIVEGSGMTIGENNTWTQTNGPLTVTTGDVSIGDNSNVTLSRVNVSIPDGDLLVGAGASYLMNKNDNNNNAALVLNAGSIFIGTGAIFEHWGDVPAYSISDSLNIADGATYYDHRGNTTIGLGVRIGNNVTFTDNHRHFDVNAGGFTAGDNFVVNFTNDRNWRFNIQGDVVIGNDFNAYFNKDIFISNGDFIFGNTGDFIQPDGDLRVYQGSLTTGTNVNFTTNGGTFSVAEGDLVITAGSTFSTNTGGKAMSNGGIIADATSTVVMGGSWWVLNNGGLEIATTNYSGNSYYHLDNNVVGNHNIQTSGANVRLIWIRTGLADTEYHLVDDLLATNGNPDWGLWVYRSKFFTDGHTVEVNTIRLGDGNISSSDFTGTDQILVKNEFSANNNLTNVTIDLDEADIVFESSNNQTFNGGNRTYDNDIFVNATSPNVSTVSFTGNNTINNPIDITASGDQLINFGNNATIDSILINYIRTSQSTAIPVVTLNDQDLINYLDIDATAAIRPIFRTYNHNAIGELDLGDASGLSHIRQWEIQNGKVQTINSITGLNGTCPRPVLINSSTLNSPGTISVATGTVSGDFLRLQDNIATGGASFVASNTLDFGNVTGWTFAAVTAQDFYWIGNSGDWDDPNAWSFTSGGTPAGCVPTRVDNVFFDDNSFSASGQFCNTNIIAECHNMTWESNLESGAGLVGNFDVLVFGSLELSEVMNFAHNGDFIFESFQGGETIETHGVIMKDMIFRAQDQPGGEWSLVDSLRSSGIFNLERGEFHTFTSLPNGAVSEFFVGNSLIDGNFYSNGEDLRFGTTIVRPGDTLFVTGGDLSIFNTLTVNGVVDSDGGDIYVNTRFDINGGTARVYAGGGNLTVQTNVFYVYNSGIFDQEGGNATITVPGNWTQIASNGQVLAGGGDIFLLDFYPRSGGLLKTNGGEVSIRDFYNDQDNATLDFIGTSLVTIRNRFLNLRASTNLILDTPTTGDAGVKTDFIIQSTNHHDLNLGNHTFNKITALQTAGGGRYFMSGNNTIDSLIIIRNGTGDIDVRNGSTIAVFNIESTSISAINNNYFIRNAGNNFGEFSVKGTAQYRPDLLFIASINVDSFYAEQMDEIRFWPPGNVFEFGDFNVIGNCSDATLIRGETAGVASTVNISGTTDIDAATLIDLNSSGSTGIVEANGSADGGNVSGWTIVGGSDFFWVGNNGNWNDLNSWSYTSGGGTAGCLPNRGDNVFFDVNSFSAPNQTVNVNIPAEFNNMVWNNVNAPRLGGNQILNSYGSLLLDPNMTWINNNWLYFQSRKTGNTINTNGVSLRYVQFLSDGTFDGEWTLQSDLDVLNDVYVQRGTLRTDGFDISARSFFNTVNSANTTIDFTGSSLLSLRHRYEMGTNTNLVIGDLDIQWDNMVSYYRFYGGNKTYNNLTFNHNVGANEIQINGNNNVDNLTINSNGNPLVTIDGNTTWNDITFLFDNSSNNIPVINFNGANTANVISITSTGSAGPHIYLDQNNMFEDLIAAGVGTRLVLGVGSTQTVNGLISLGSGSFPVFVRTTSDVTGDVATIYKPSGEVCLDFVLLQNIVGSGDSDGMGGIQTDYFAGASSVDLLGNSSNWNFTSCGAYYWVGDSGDWSDFSGHWATSTGGTAFHASVPGPDDNVFFDANSFTAPNQIVNVDVANANMANISWQSALFNPTLDGNAANVMNVYGDLDLIPTMNQDFEGVWNFLASDNGNTINSGGQTLTDVNILGGSDGEGEWALVNSLLVADDLNFQNGTLITDDKNISTTNFNVTSAMTQSLDLGSSEVTISNGNWNPAELDDTELIEGTSNIVLAGEGGTSNFIGNGLTYHDVSYTTASSLNGTMTGANTMNELTIGLGLTLTMEAGVTQLTNNIIANGTCDNLTEIESSVPGTPSIFSQATGTVDLLFVELTDNTAAGGATFNANNSIDNGGNTGWNFLSLPATLVATISTTDVDCLTNNDGSASVDAVSGGTPPYAYVWSTTATTSSIANLIPGTYSVTITDATGCFTEETSAVVNEPSIITPTPFTASATEICLGTVINFMAGTPPEAVESYLWDFGDFTGSTDADVSHSYTSNGTYEASLSYIDADGCPSIVTETITVSDLQATALDTDVSCFGFGDGTIEITATNGIEPYEYSIDNGGTYVSTSSFTGLAPGSYQVKVTDANQCETGTINVNITQPSSAVASAVTQVNTSCSANEDGEINIVGSGGTPPYQYSINNGIAYLNTANFIELPFGTYNVIVRDNNLCVTAAETIVIVVEDTEDPTIICPSDKSEVAVGGACDAFITVSLPTVNDNCGVASTTNNYNGTADASDTYPTGTTNIVWTVTDINGRTATCTSTVTVTENTPPTITCASDTVVMNIAGLCSADVVLNVPITDDNCSTVTLTNDAPATYIVGTTLVTWTATDATGNTAQCTQNVTVVDSEEPTITCIGTQSLPIVANCEIALPDYTGMVNASDNCSVASVIQTPAAGTMVTIGVTSVTITATDPTNASVDCDFDVNVSDGVNPTITCPTAVAQTADTGACEASVTIAAPTTGDNCGVGSVTNDYNNTADASDIYPVGTTMVTWTVTDDNGLTATCVQNVIVTDDEDPTIACTTLAPQNTDNGVCESAVTIAAPLTGDNCGVGSVTNDYNNTSDASDTYPVGTTMVTWTVTDDNGRTASCVQNVVVTDGEVPTASCTDVTVNLDASLMASIVATDLNDNSSDNCDMDLTYTIISGQTSYDCSDVGMTYTIMMEVSDDAGNVSTCSSIVTVTDTNSECNAAPTAICDDIVVDANGNCEGIAIATDFDNGSFDPDAGDVLTITVLPAGPYVIGTTDVVLTVADQDGLFSTCDASITVIDNEAPTPMLAILANVVGQCEASVSIPEATDNCGGTIVGTTTDDTYYNAQGTYTVTWTYSDGTNSTTQTQMVIVNDTEGPEIICPSTQFQEADVNCESAALDYTGLASAMDNCTAVTFTQVPLVGTALDLGPNVIMITAMDENGNASMTCCFMVEVTLPVPTLNDDMVSSGEDQSINIDVLDNDAGLCSDDNTVIITSQPGGGTAVVNPDNTITFTSAEHEAGCIEFVYSVTTNPLPTTANNDAVSTGLDEAITIQVLNNDNDPQGDPLTVSLISGASNGNAVLNANGTFTYTPNSGFSGIDEFVYEVNDGNGNTSQAAVSINVRLADPGTIHYLPVKYYGSGHANYATQLWINTEDPAGATGTITTASGQNIPFAVTNTNTYTLGLPNNNTRGITSLVNSIRNEGLVVTSDNAAINVQLVQENSNGQSFLNSKSLVALGKVFYAGQQASSAGFAYESNGRAIVSVIATEDNTNITITRPPGTTWNWTGTTSGTINITLNAGQSYMVSYNGTNASITGAKVVSDKLVAVSSGNFGVFYTNGGGAVDNGWDNLVPVERVGTDYIVLSTVASPDEAYVVATVDGTTVDINGTNVATLNAGEHYTHVMTGVAANVVYSIQTSNPAYVYHNGGNVNNRGENGLALIAPIDVNGRGVYRFRTPQPNASVPVAFITSTSAVPTFKLTNVTGGGNTVILNGPTSTTLPGRPDLSLILTTLSQTTEFLVESDAFVQISMRSGAGGGGGLSYIAGFSASVLIAADDNFPVVQDNSATFSPLGNDSDADGNIITIANFDQPANGSVVDNGNGTFTYTPNSGYVGTDQFAYTITNGLSFFSTATIFLDVQALPTATVQVDVAPIVDDPGLLASDMMGMQFTAIANNITIAGSPDVDGSEAITLVIITGVPTSITLSAGTSDGAGNWTLTEAELATLTATGTELGSYPVTITITNADSVIDCDGQPVLVFEDYAVPFNIIIECPDINFMTTHADEICPDANDGTITISGETGGVGPYMYSFDNGVTFDVLATAEDLVVGTYSVIIKDSQDCESEAQQVTIDAGVDTTPPDIVCMNITIALGADGTAMIEADEVDGGTTDNCRLDELEINMNSFDCSNVGPNTVILTATDESGNSSSCSATVTVIDNIQPVISCVDITVQLDVAGNASITQDQINGGSSDICGIASETIDVTVFDCSMVGANTVILTVTDNNNNVSTCAATVTVEDNVMPNVICQDLILYLDASGAIAFDPMDIDNGSSDACGIIDYSLDVTSFDCDNTTTTNQVTLTITDSNNNMASCTAMVTILDTINPMITCPLDITIGTDTGICEATNVDLTIPTVADNCTTIVPVFEGGVDVPQLFVGERGGFFSSVDDAGNRNVIANLAQADGVVFINSNTAIVSRWNGSGPSLYEIDLTSGTATALVSLGGLCQGLSIASNGEVLVANEGAKKIQSVNLNTLQVTEVVTGLNRVVDVVQEANGDYLYSDFNTNRIYRVDFVTKAITTLATGLNRPTDIFLEDDGNVIIAEFGGAVSRVNTTTGTRTVIVSQGGGPHGIAKDFENNIFVSLFSAGKIIKIDPGNTVTDFSTGHSNPVFIGRNPANIFTQGDNVITWIATDASGNTATCEQTITVVDDELPTIMCPEDLTISSNDTDCFASNFDLGTPIVGDNCGIESVTNNALDELTLGTHIITWTIIDETGNVATCEQTVQVVDNIAPVAICQDITIQLDATGNVTINETDIDMGSSDACGIASLVLDQTSFSCPAVGSNTVTMTVTDVNGNTTICTSTVTVEDNVDPTAICQNVTAELDEFGMASITPQMVDNGSNDACGIANLALDNDSFGCANVGSNTVVLTVTDSNGNTSTCESTITVVDNVTPNAVCQNITVALDNDGNVSIVPADINNGSDDACGIADMTLDIMDFDCSNVGVNTVILTVTDNNSNVSTCSATVTVVDDQSPALISCPADQVLTSIEGDCSALTSWLVEIPYDNCGVASVVFTAPGVQINSIPFGNLITTFGLFPVGTTTVTMTVTDNNNNVVDCTFDITVNDEEAPEITNCPSDMTVNSDAGTCGAFVQYGIVTASDNCPGVTLDALTGHSVDGEIFPVGTTAVEFLATDASGNTTTCAFNVTVNDNELPVVVCQDINLTLDAAGNVAIVANDVFASATDNCEVDMSSLSIDVSSFDCSNIGANTVIVSIADIYGNVGTCNATVTIDDDTLPTVMCQDITVNLDLNGNVSIEAADVDNASDDACGIMSTEIDVNSFDCSKLGANNVILTVTDNNGNVANCTAIVTVVDAIAPTLVCPANITVYTDPGTCEAIVDYAATTSDNCEADIVYSIPPMSAFSVGNMTVAVTSTDPSGNFDACNFVVTVIDNELPVLECPDDITLSADLGACVATGFTLEAAIAADACGISTITDDALTSYTVGSHTVTYVATDGNGNSVSCTQMITVEDNEAPTVSCNDITIDLTNRNDYELTTADIDAIAMGSTDNCGNITYSITAGVTTFNCDVKDQDFVVTLTVVDDAGNTSTCDATISITDSQSVCNDPPMALCTDVTIFTGDNCDAMVTAAEVDGGSTDPDGDDLTLTLDNYGPFGVGTHTVTLTVTDGEFEATCTAEVTVEDNTPPTAACQNITVQLDATGHVGINANMINNGSSDACGVQIISIDNNAFTCANVGPNTVVLTVIDIHGNMATCSSTVTVEDNVDPVAMCENITVQLDDAGMVNITADQLDAGSTDACGIASLEIDVDNFGCSAIGANTVILTVTDNNGNESTCTSTVTVEDNVDPIAMCQNITVQLDDTGMASITANQIDAGSTDACGIASLDLDIDNFDCSTVGANTVTLTATDSNGNESTCSAIITVEDNVDPTAICQDITVQLDVNGNASITADDIDNGSNDACGIASIEVDVTDFDCNSVGEITQPNNYALDFDGQNDFLQSMTTNALKVLPLTVEAWVNPTMRTENTNFYPNNVVSNDTPGQFGHGFGANVNNSINQITIEYENGFRVINNAGLQVGVWQHIACVYTSGNVKTYVDGVLIDNFNYGQAALNANATFIIGKHNNDAGYGTRRFYKGAIDEVRVWHRALSAIEITDNMSTTSLGNEDDLALYFTFEDGPGSTSVTDIASGDMATLYDMDPSTDWITPGAPVDNAVVTVANPVILTVTDNNGNVSTCLASVIVEDNVAPLAMCQDFTVQLDAAGSASIAAEDIDNGSSDACGIATLEIDTNNFNCSNVGGNTVTLTVTDVHGNESTCLSTVTVEDNVDPIAVCKDITVQLDENGAVNITAADIDNGSSDACGIASMSVNTENFGCFHVGENIVVLTVVDANGNEATCSSTVTVEDNVAPVAMCQDFTVALDINGMATITANDIDNGSSDGCGVANLEIDMMSFDCSHIGVNTVTLTVTDQNGNSSECTSTVTVEENVDPQANCQNITVQLDEAGLASITANDIDNGSMDACGIANLDIDVSNFDCTNVGLNTVILTVTDANGNESTCTSTVTVEDMIAPEAMCQDITVQLDNNGLASITTADIDSGSTDACGIASLTLSLDNFDCSHVGDNTVILTVTDVNNNVTTCSSTVTVEDMVAPVASCQAIVVELDQNGMVTITANQVDDGSADACGIADLSVDVTNFDCNNIGSNDVILTVTDNNGNVSTCATTVTVEDNVSPVAMCQDITVQLDNNGAATITANEVDNGSTDACGIESLELNTTSFGCNNIGSNVVILTVTDMNGNTSICSSSVTVEDNVDPIISIIAANASAECDGAGNAAELTTWLAANAGAAATDACSVEWTNDFVSLSNDCGATGTVTVEFTATDPSGNTATTSASFTIVDTTAPSITCEGNVSTCADQTMITSSAVSWNEPTYHDACGSVSVTSTHNSGDVFPVGTTIVTYTATDDCGNAETCSFDVTVFELPEVTITEDENSVYCQGDYKLLTANTNSNVGSITFAWSNGDATETTEVSTTGTYSVIVTDGNGCTRETSYDVIVNAEDLLSAYTILGQHEVHLNNENFVFEGGVGVFGIGEKAKINGWSSVSGPSTFVKADIIQITGGSVVDNPISDPTNIALPAFLNNPHSSSNDVSVPNNANVVLTDQIYGSVTINKNATVTFTQKDIYIENLDIRDDATVEFATCAFVRVSHYMDIDKRVVINSQGSEVNFFAGCNVSIKKGSEIDASINAQGQTIHVVGHQNDHTVMEGQFIANLVHGNNHVDWFRGNTCDPTCQPEDVEIACDPTGTNTSDEWIESVTFNGTTSQTGNDGGYGDYTGTILPLTTGINNVTLEPGFAGQHYNEYWSIFIDYNNDGDYFDAGEYVATGQSSNTVTGTINVPNYAAANTTMRIIMSYHGYQDPCDVFTYGEVEDYSVSIDFCYNLTDGGVIGSNQVLCGDMNDPEILEDIVSPAGGSGNTEYVWLVSTTTNVPPVIGGMNGWSEVANSNVASLDPGPITENTWYLRCARREGCIEYTGESNVIELIYNESCTIDYCESEGQSTYYEWIQKVKVGNIDNNSGNDYGYGDYSYLSTTMNQGSSHNITLKPGFLGSKYREYWRVWVDWNHDGDFDDAGELEVQKSSKNTISKWITVPANAVVGETRMRVSMRYGGYAWPCEDFTYGEVEDYTIYVGGSSLTEGELADTRTDNSFDEDESLDLEMTIYPNPAHSNVTIALDGLADGEITIYDQLGQVVLEKELDGAREWKFNAQEQNMAPGVYRVAISSQGSRITKPLIIVR